MNTRIRHGRSVPRRPSPLPIFYAILGIVAVIGVAAIAASGLGSSQATTTGRTDRGVRTLTAPAGRTAAGFAYKGKPDAPVQVVEYADFQCPACARFFQLLEPTLDQHYINSGKVQLIFHDF